MYHIYSTDENMKNEYIVEALQIIYRVAEQPKKSGYSAQRVQENKDP